MQKTRVKIIFFGTPDFAVPVLESLVEEGYDIVAVITQPDKPTGRNQIPTPPPIKLAAQKLIIPVWQPKSLKDPEFLNSLKPITYNLKPDLGIVAAYGKIIPPEILNLPKHGLLNIHPSLLPKYRGPSPVQTALLNGDTETGVTIMKVDEEMDHGPIVANYKLKITSYKSSEEAHTALFKLGADLLIKLLPDYITGKIQLQPQYDSQAIYTHKFTATDGEIKSNESAEQAYNKIRALNPEPGTFVWLKKDEKKLRLKILEANLKNKCLEISRVQLEGGKPMALQEFLAGHPNFKNNLLQLSHVGKNS